MCRLHVHNVHVVPVLAARDGWGPAWRLEGPGAGEGHVQTEGAVGAAAVVATATASNFVLSWRELRRVQEVSVKGCTV